MRALAAAKSGREVVILIEGSPGIGKTRLLAEARDLATRRGFRVVAGDGLRQPMPSASAQDAGTVQRPKLIVLDDLQWADLTVLHEVGRAPAQPPPRLAWILARRSGKGGAQLNHIFTRLAESGAERIELGPIPDDAAAELATDTLGAQPNADLMTMISGAGGHPMLLVELLEGLGDEGGVEVVDGRARPVHDHLPGRARIAVRRQFEVLNGATRQMLRVAAVIGRTFGPDDLVRLSGEPLVRLLPAIQQATDAGILVSSAEALTFRHPMVRQAVTESIPTAMRRALEAEARRTLPAKDGSVTPPADPSAPPPADPAPDPQAHRTKVVEGLAIAAQEMLVSAPQTAASIATRALALSAPAAPGRATLAVLAVEALAAAGRVRDATALAQTALAERLPPATAARVRYALSAALLMSGQSAAAVAEAEKIMAASGQPDQFTRLARAAHVYGLMSYDAERARNRAQAILANDGKDDDPTAIAALSVLGTLTWHDGDLADGLRLGRESVRLIGDQPPQMWHPLALLALAAKLGDLRERAAADALCEQAREQSNTLGLVPLAALPLVFEARILAQAGRYADAAAEAEGAIDLARTLDAWAFTPLAQTVCALAALRDDDLFAAVHHVERYQDQLATLDAPYASAQYDWVALQVAAAQGGARHGANLLATRYADLPTRRSLLIEEPGAASWMVRTALVVEDRALAERVLATADALAADNPGFDSVTASAVHARGLFEEDPHALEQAAADHRDLWAGACAAEDLGVLLTDRRGSDERKSAVRNIKLALERYEAIGAARDAVRARCRLNRLGVSHRRRSGAGRDTGWQSLTETQRVIIGLVTQGLTNRQVADQMLLSPHTIDAHLRRIFRKLEISSRVQLARLAAKDLARPDDRLAPPSNLDSG